MRCLLFLKYSIPLPYLIYIYSHKLSTMNKETITLKNLSIGYTEKRKNPKYIARNIQASLWGGELTCLLGSNGAGKSTLLRTLSAFLSPLDGEILVFGKSLNKLTENERARLIGVVLTDRTDLRDMSVRELVSLGRSPYTNFWGSLSAEDYSIIESSLNMVGMASMAERMVNTLSDGERQKAMIAKALAQETPIIFLDEPTAFLDFPSKVEMMLLLRRLARQMNKTIFLSTHDLELALQIADKLWLMKRVRGENISAEDSLIIGTPKDLADNGDLSHFFDGKGCSFDSQTMRFRIETE